MQFRWRLIASESDIERGVLLLHMPGILSYSEQFGEFLRLEISPPNDGYSQLERGWRYHPESKKGTQEKQSRTAMSASSKKVRHNPCVSFSKCLLWLHCLSVSIFAEIQLPSACLPKRKDRR